ncbi:MAG TPA: tRNA (5-methylaminomethyl-2-thiouridine)(34)-methyltransferase MnmD, partial [Chitinophagales bacterium]|nr:tRNA (5-methylaminomethyl-2-thiouridine)(34)-methyltransferase MnmD [Chitinophagales bacterium]
ILEVGLGTGLNACLTFAHAGESEIHYTALEPFPLENIVLDELNYGAWIDRKLFAALHDAVWNVSRPVAGNHSGSFKKLKISIEDFRTDEKFNLVYFDAFAAHVHPELWTEKIFSKIFQMLDKGGALVTYSAKGSVKRALKSCGFVVETLPGAPGKREMVRASRPRQSSD